MEGWTQLASVKLSESSQTKDIWEAGDQDKQQCKTTTLTPSLETAVHFHRTTKALPAHRVDSLGLNLNYI